MTYRSNKDSFTKVKTVAKPYIVVPWRSTQGIEATTVKNQRINPHRPIGREPADKL